MEKNLKWIRSCIQEKYSNSFHSFNFTFSCFRIYRKNCFKICTTVCCSRFKYMIFGIVLPSDYFIALSEILPKKKQQKQLNRHSNAWEPNKSQPWLKNKRKIIMVSDVVNEIETFLYFIFMLSSFCFRSLFSLHCLWQPKTTISIITTGVHKVFELNKNQK